MKCGLYNSMPELDYIFVGWPRIHLTGPSVVPEPNTFFEDLLLSVVRKLFLHLKENICIRHMQSGSHCWTWELLLAFEI